MQTIIATKVTPQSSPSFLRVPLDGSSGLSPDVRELDLERIVHKVASEKGWSAQRRRQAELDYRRFLQLRVLHPATSLVPSLDIDALWHAHILDTRTYACDCERLFGRFMHHVPAYDDGEQITLQREFEATQRLWEATFGATLVDSARCDGKPCHVETPCRCR